MIAELGAPAPDDANLDLHLRLRFLERSLPIAERWGWLDLVTDVTAKATVIADLPAAPRYLARARAVLELASEIAPRILDRILLRSGGPTTDT